MSLSFQVLASGSGGNVGVVSTLEDGEPYEILVDAGIPWRYFEQRGVVIRPRAVVVTHEHSDHVRFAAEYARIFRIPVYATKGTQGYRELATARAELRTLESEKAVHIGPIELRPFATPHDAAESVGLVFRAGKSALGWVTDLGEVTPLVEQHMLGCDAALLEFNHDPQMLKSGPYPWPLKRRILGPQGHLSNEQAAELLQKMACRGRLRHVVLAHLSETNNSPELARRAAKDALAGTQVSLALAEQRRPIGPFPVLGPATQLSLF